MITKENIKREVRRAFFALCDDNNKFPMCSQEVKKWKIAKLVTYAFYNVEGVAPEFFDYSEYIDRGLLHCDTFKPVKGFWELVISTYDKHLQTLYREALNVA